MTRLTHNGHQLIRNRLTIFGSNYREIMQLFDLPVGQISRPSRSDAEKSKTLLFSIVG
jgi:hypothetical protein